MEELLDLILGGRNRRRQREGGGIGEDISDTIGGVTKFLIGCGCILVAVIIAGIILLVGGVVTLGDKAIVVIVVVGMIIVAVASLIRSTIFDRFPGQ